MGRPSLCFFFLGEGRVETQSSRCRCSCAIGFLAVAGPTNYTSAAPQDTSFPEARTTSLRSVVLHSGLSPSIRLVRDWTNDACQCVAPGPISDCGLSPPTKLFPEPSGGGCTRRGCRANYILHQAATSCALKSCAVNNVGAVEREKVQETNIACSARQREDEVVNRQNSNTGNNKHRRIQNLVRDPNPPVLRNCQ